MSHCIIVIDKYNLIKVLFIFPLNHEAMKSYIMDSKQNKERKKTKASMNESRCLSQDRDH